MAAGGKCFTRFRSLCQLSVQTTSKVSQTAPHSTVSRPGVRNNGGITKRLKNRWIGQKEKKKRISSPSVSRKQKIYSSLSRSSPLASSASPSQPNPCLSCGEEAALSGPRRKNARVRRHPRRTRTHWIYGAPNVNSPATTPEPAE